MDSTFSADLAKVYESATLLRQALDGTLLPSDVMVWSGPAQVSTATSYNLMMAKAGESIGLELDGVLALLDLHAESLTAAAATLQETEDDAVALSEEAQANLDAAQGITEYVTQAGQYRQDTAPDVTGTPDDGRTGGV